MIVPINISINGKEFSIEATLTLPPQYQRFPLILKSKIILESNLDINTPIQGINNIYFIHCAGTQHYKIDSHVDPLEKIKELQIGCPFKLELIACCPGEKSVENDLIAKYKDKYRDGWLVLDDIEAHNVIDEMTGYFINQSDKPKEHKAKSTKFTEFIKRIVPSKANDSSE
ncbi:Hypothetical protein HVR_LOCUS369 [uncultured virus]|nr:Hypothetical protein HVR_LOCUS369 [uncultured virus]